MRAADELGPGEGGGDVDRGQLPDRTLGAGEAANEEAVDPDQLAGSLSPDVAPWLRLARRPVGRRVAGDQRQPPRARVEPVPTQAAPDTVMADDDPAPAPLAQLARDPARPEAGMAERKGHDPLLQKRRQLLRHPRPPTLPRTQDLQPMPLHPALPNVVGRAVDPEHPAGLAHARPAGVIEHAQPVAEQCVIL